MKDAIQVYHSSNIATLPVKDDKSPYGVHTWKGGVTNLGAYDGAFGIGIVCGQASGGVECLDFDNHFDDAKTTVSRFVEELGDVYSKYNFVIQSTTSGGYHMIYRCETVSGNIKLAERPKWEEGKNRWRPDAIIETRGEGGYFVAAPTPGYKVLRGSFSDMPVITREDRQHIIDVAKSFNTWYELAKNENETEGRPGDMFNNDLDSLPRMKSALTKDGWLEVRPQQWRRPNKTKGISATLGKVAENVFYVFSANAYPFTDKKAYTAFQVVALLEYNGDFKAFAKELGEKYGTTKPNGKQYGKQQESKKDTKELEDILSRALINLQIPVAKPPVAIKIRDFENGALWDKRLFTLGNFSAITGKSKSKKTFFGSILLAAAVKNGVVFNKIIGSLPDNKRNVFLFDTEQSDYDAYITAKRVPSIIGEQGYINFGAFDLREYTPLDRCQIIEFALECNRDKVGFVVIDGIADLANARNDEIEATRVVSLLMKWTKIYQCHIVTVIHQNKNDNYATGHLGSEVMKKAECVIAVSKDDSDARKSNVKCDLIRGTSDFRDFSIEVTNEGIPVIREFENISSHYEVNDVPF
jgi:hypothetical protein